MASTNMYLEKNNPSFRILPTLSDATSIMASMPPLNINSESVIL